MRIKIAFLPVFLLLFLSCKTKSRINTSSESSNELQQKVLQLIDCLNAYDFDCVSQYYADDYESWEPPLKITNKAAFIKKMETNYRQNKLHIKAEVLELRQRAEIGYVHLQWRLYSINEEANEAEILLDKQATQIWERNQAGQWTLKRSLFGS